MSCFFLPWPRRDRPRHRVDAGEEQARRRDPRPEGDRVDDRAVILLAVENVILAVAGIVDIGVGAGASVERVVAGPAGQNA